MTFHKQLPAPEPFPSLPDWFNWPFVADSAHLGGWGFWISTVSFLVTLGGFALTLKQLRATRSAADAARTEALRIEKSLNRYEVINEVTRATTALEAARKYLRNDLLPHVADSYEVVRDGLEALKSDDANLVGEYSGKIDEACVYIQALCVRIEQGIHKKNVSINVPKTLAMMSEHRLLLSSISRNIEKGLTK